MAAPPLVPEIRLHLATEVTPIWQATADLLEDAGVDPPFWAFAWPGGQAIARYILDRPHIVAGRRVLDFAAGCGLGAIAAARAGAAAVTASDTDRFAVRALEMNARLNGADIVATSRDLTAPVDDVDDEDIAWEVVLAGDVFYDRAMAAAVGPFLLACARGGATVLAGDPGRAYLPASGLVRLATYEVETSLDLEDRTARTTNVWRVDPAATGTAA